MTNNDEWHIEKLKGNDNYHVWCFAMTNLLALNGLEDCILAEDNANIEKNAEKLKKAKVRIALSVDPSIYSHIQNITTASAMWMKLKSLYEDSGLIRWIGLLRKLINTRLESSKSMQDYVNQVIETSNKLRGIGFEVADEWLGSILLAGLTDNFKPMIMGIESSGLNITADTVRTKLLDVCVESTSETAFFEKSSCKKEKFKSKAKS